MKRKIVFITALLVSFFIGFAINEISDSSTLANQDFKKVTGVGGIFFKSENPKLLKAWYNKNLGLDTIETYEYGKFAHILDIENNKIELWEPYDDYYNKLVEGRTK